MVDDICLFGVGRGEAALFMFGEACDLRVVLGNATRGGRVDSSKTRPLQGVSQQPQRDKRFFKTATSRS